MIAIYFLVFALVARFLFQHFKNRNLKKVKQLVPISVNFHFTRQCNYECGFCFHTAKTSDVPTIENAKTVLKKLANAGMKKLNFSGGEPFLIPKYLAELLQYSKTELQLESVSIVSNGSKIEKKFLEKYKDYIDILAISCDSFEETTNKKIGRGKGTHVRKLVQISSWCREYGIKFKLNTVVNKYNCEEDMNVHIECIRPFRWKCFQVLIIENENGGDNTLRDAREFVITRNEFQSFLDRHKHHACLVPEPNDVMMNSYLILDEHLSFLNCTNNDKKPSDSLLRVDVETALQQAGWDQRAFAQRSGIYAWSKNVKNCGNSTSNNRLDW